MKVKFPLQAYYAMLDDFKNQMALAIGSFGNAFHNVSNRVAQIMQELGYISVNQYLPDVPRNPRKRGRLFRRVNASARYAKHAL